MIEARLADLCQIKHGFAFSGDRFSTDPRFPTLVTPGNFKIGGGFREAKPKTFDGEAPADYVLSPGAIIVTMTDLSKAGDTLGFPARVPSEGTYLHNQRIGLVEVTSDELLADFLYYALMTDAYRHHVLAGATGSTVRHTSPKRILDFRLLLPSLDLQRGIAGVLGALDDLIDTNQRLAESAGQLWRALVAQATSLGPSSESPLASLARFVNGRNFTKGADGSGRPVVRTPEVRNGPSSSTVRSSVEAADDHIARYGDILFVWSGSLTAATWIAEEGLVNQHVFKVIPADGVPPWMVMFAIEEQMPRFLGLAADKATTMGHIKRSDLDDAVEIPAKDAWSGLARSVEPLWEAEAAYIAENGLLKTTRNELLPLLLSGRVLPGEVAV